MSRIGKDPIAVPADVKIDVKDGVFVAEGPKGKVSQALTDTVRVEVDGGVVRVLRTGETGSHRSQHGLMRALLANAVQGVKEGFKRRLEIHGVGYKAEVKGREVHFALGYSHPVVYPIPESIHIEVEKGTAVTVAGADRQLVGQVAAEIRGLRRPEPYKGKGIRYSDEVLRRKVGKAGAAK